MHIDFFTHPQRETLELVRANQPIPARRNASLHVLARYGHIDHNADVQPAGFRLTSVGQAVFDEDACRRNQVDDFHPGQLVERSEFRRGRDGKMTHEWMPYIVAGLGVSRLIVAPGDDVLNTDHRAMEPRYFRSRQPSKELDHVSN